MKPHPIASLMGSRKTIVSIVSLVLCALVLLVYRGTIEEKVAAVSVLWLHAWKLIDSITKEDLALKNAEAASRAGATSQGGSSQPPGPRSPFERDERWHDPEPPR